MRRFLPIKHPNGDIFLFYWMGKFALAQEDGTENDSKDRELVLGPERQESKDERKDSTLNIKPSFPTSHEFPWSLILYLSFFVDRKKTIIIL